MEHQPDSQRLVAGALEDQILKRTQSMIDNDFQGRFWKKDASLWGEAEMADAVAPWLGWIDIIPRMRSRIDEITSFANEVKGAGFKRVVLCGMGGSSLAPLVLEKCVADGSGLALHVLDLTDPASVMMVEESGDLSETFFIVASKSGTTAEPSAFDAYFWEKCPNGGQFAAITDPGNPFEASAMARGFRHVFLNFADIGGRFSALSYFGLVPAALLGINLDAFLDRARIIVDNAAAAFELGAAMGELARGGRNKLTFLTPDALYPMGLWLEQLVAESTGKLGRGILPIAGEPVTGPEHYGSDRVFVYLHDSNDSALRPQLHALENAGHPTVDIELGDRQDLAQEFMRFEIATAVAGSVLSINPFDQPNVQESKDITKRLLAEVEEKGALPADQPRLTDGQLSFFGEEGEGSANDFINAFFANVGPGDFAVIMAFLSESPELTEALRNLQRCLRDGLKVSTTMGYGPRFLHSTGQFHKGGPNNGFFIQLTANHAKDAAVPGQRATWGQFVDAQAAGDLQALKQKGRRAIRVNLGDDALAGVAELTKVVENWFDWRNLR